MPNAYTSLAVLLELSQSGSTSSGAWNRVVPSARGASEAGRPSASVIQQRSKPAIQALSWSFTSTFVGAKSPWTTLLVWRYSSPATISETLEKTLKVHYFLMIRAVVRTNESRPEEGFTFKKSVIRPFFIQGDTKPILLCLSPNRCTPRKGRTFACES